MNFNFKNLTERELDFRDKFWGPKISKKAPSPNFLVIIRIIGAILLFFLKLEPIYFFIFVILLFLTDYFDGIIARTQNKETLFGKWADPIADKLLLFVIIYSLYFQNVIFWKPLILPIIIPEILIIIIGLIPSFFGKKIVIKPIIWVRLKLTFYFLAILWFLIGNYIIANILFIIGIVFAFIYVGSYLIKVLIFIK